MRLLRPQAYQPQLQFVEGFNSVDYEGLLRPNRRQQPFRVAHLTSGQVKRDNFRRLADNHWEPVCYHVNRNTQRQIVTYQQLIPLDDYPPIPTERVTDGGLFNSGSGCCGTAMCEREHPPPPQYLEGDCLLVLFVGVKGDHPDYRQFPSLDSCPYAIHYTTAYLDAVRRYR